MCGVAGYWAPRGATPPATLERMTAALRHRGPDGAGQWFSPAGGPALGHRRLAIVDLGATGQQPMASASGRYVVVFNGEIYNFRALRRELAAQGHAFRGTSDTEVMLAAFEQYGVAPAVTRFSGMFAFAVFDQRERVLWLGRDRLGEKPLYVVPGETACLFGSELKAIAAHGGVPLELSRAGAAAVLRYGYIPAPDTIYRGVEKLRPGELLGVREMADGRLTYARERYWHAVPSAVNARTRPFTSGEAADAVEAILTEVIGEQMLADVPVGAFLSGGIDSSLVVALMQRQSAVPVRTFTIAFAESTHDESAHAAAIARHLGTEHCEIRLEPTMALESLERLPTIFDEPFADSSQLPTWLVARETRRHVTVALTGDGGDELFGGYSQYTGPDTLGRLVDGVPGPLRGITGAALEIFPASALERALRWGGGRGWPPAARQRLLRGLRQRDQARLYEDRQARWIEPGDLLAPDLTTDGRWTGRQEADWSDALSPTEATMLYDTQTYLPGDILVKVDRTSMAHSLETRAPLLDHRVFEAAWRTPLPLKVANGQGKQLLRELLSRYIPRPMFERPKQGFAIPLAHWLRTDLRGWAEDLLKDTARSSTPMRAGVLDRVWGEHLAGTFDHSERLWSALVLLQWFRRAA